MLRITKYANIDKWSHFIVLDIFQTSVNMVVGIPFFET